MATEAKGQRGSRGERRASVSGARQNRDRPSAGQSKSGRSRGRAASAGEPEGMSRIYLDRVLDGARGIGQGSTEFASQLAATVRDNPIPIALMAAGVASLVASERMSKRRGERTSADGSDREAGYGERATELAAGARSAADALGERAKRGGAALVERMRGPLRQVRDGGARALQEQPLLAAGLGLAVGAALGAALPLSERERRALGPARQRVVERAQAIAREGAERVREGAERVREGAERVRGLAERAAGGDASTASNKSASRRRQSQPDEDEDEDADEFLDS